MRRLITLGIAVLAVAILPVSALGEGGNVGLYSHPSDLTRPAV